MSRMPHVSARELVRFLKSRGFVEDRQAGSHLTMWHEEKNITVTVPVHTGCDIGRGLAVRILKDAGFTMAYPERRASHEFILTLKEEKKNYGITAMDFAKRLLDYGYHAPTTYFPLLVPECFLIEPTETECKQEIDGFVDAMTKVLKEAQESHETLQTAPHHLPSKRLDDVKAARELDLKFQQESA